MIVRDAGHDYELQVLDGDEQTVQYLTFVKRMGEKYPGNEDAYPGTIMQEVLRALLDRARHVMGQGVLLGYDEAETRMVIDYLGIALYLLEHRAARLHGVAPPSRGEAEWGKACWKCGHVRCGPDCEGLLARE